MDAGDGGKRFLNERLDDGPSVMYNDEFLNPCAAVKSIEPVATSRLKVVRMKIS
jgi:hypothetical protein